MNRAFWIVEFQSSAGWEPVERWFYSEDEAVAFEKHLQLSQPNLVTQHVEYVPKEKA